MSLKLKKVNSFRSRVNVMRATDDADRMQEVSFVAEFKYLGRQAVDDLLESQPTDAEFLDEVLLGLEEVADESGQPVAFDVAKSAIQDDLGLSAATVKQFMKGLGGEKEKNSRRSRGR